MRFQIHSGLNLYASNRDENLNFKNSYKNLQLQRKHILKEAQDTPSDNI